MYITPEMIEFLRKNALKHNTNTITDLFNKYFNTNKGTNSIRELMYYYNITFKKSHGKKKPIGSEMIMKNIIYVKISNDKGNWNKRWKKKQAILWEQKHGIIPNGYCVIFLDNNNRNFELDNLELVSRIEYGLLNRWGLHFNDKEMTKVGLTIVRQKLATLKFLTNGMSDSERVNALNKIYYKKRRMKEKRETSRPKKSD